MELLCTDTLDEARQKLWEQSAGLKLKTEVVELSCADGRISAQDITAEENIPPFSRSVVDGYAVRASDTYGSSESGPAFLKVIGAVNIEQAASCELHAGEAVRVQTGSMMPAGADAAVMAEYAEEYVPWKLAVYRSVAQGENVIREGEDIARGRRVLFAGKTITPSDAGMLAALGIAKIKVLERLNVTVISTGDELVGMGEQLSQGKIRDINTYILAAEVRRMGMCVKRTLRLPDDEEMILKATADAVADSDIVLLSGGSSKGKKDYTKQVFEKISGNVFTHGIAVKPGKPTILSYDTKRGTILAGLPGHPAAALLMFRLIIGDWYRKRAGGKPALKYPALLSENVSSNQGRATCLLVELSFYKGGAGGMYEAVPIHAKSGSISAVSRAAGYVMIPREREGLKKGEIVWVEVFE